MSVKSVKKMQESVFQKLKVNAALFIQALIYSGLLIGGTLFGLILREYNVQGFTIFFLVAIINVGATLFVFSDKMLKRNLKDLFPVIEEESKQGKKKKKENQSSYQTPSDL